MPGGFHPFHAGHLALYQAAQVPYAAKITKDIRQAPVSLGNKLGRLALKLDLSVIRISKATGATRQTIYNWFVGGKVAPFYRERVSTLVEIMSEAKTAEHAWRNACSRFNLRT